MEEMEVERFPNLTLEVKKWKVWIMVFFATLINIMTFGISFSFGIFQDEYKKNVLKNESNLAILSLAQLLVDLFIVCCYI
ncbi:unnamed protein product [Cunninghamella echinulata]